MALSRVRGKHRTILIPTPAASTPGAYQERARQSARDRSSLLDATRYEDTMQPRKLMVGDGGHGMMFPMILKEWRTECRQHRVYMMATSMK